MTVNDLDDLRNQWSELYSQTLPDLARAKHPSQSKWPVHLDHCFARIILDNTVGRGALQWDNVIKRPAVKNMDEAQLNEAIRLGRQIQDGKVDLVELDRRSLEARGKSGTKYKDSHKRRRDDEQQVDTDARPSSKKLKNNDKTQSTLSFAQHTDPRNGSVKPTRPLSGPGPRFEGGTKTDATPFPNPNTVDLLLKIQNHGGLTPYRKRLYSTLLSVPSGSYTTYQAMASFLTSSARAVGSGMRNNPFAPDVPCHRVLASDGSIGGFGGSWGEEGKHAGKKRQLLKSEGVHFDSKGRVKGPVFRTFEDLSTTNLLELAEAKSSSR